jgi:tetratricopeptide (TPR) repeat protein
MTESISGDELLQRAVNLHQQGCFDEAENIYNQILSKNPDHSDVLHYIGVIALQRNDFNRTITFISNALRVNKMMPWAFLNLGTSYRGLKQFDKALKSYECALKIDPLFSSAISNIGVLFYEQKNYQKSLEYFNHALSLDSSLADAYYNRTNIFLFYERFNEALHDYSQAIRLNLNNLDAYLNRGQSYKRLKKYDEAIDDFSYIIKLNPLCAEAYFHRAVTKIYRKNDDETVLHDLIKSAEINPNLRYLLGTIFFRKKQLCDWDGLEELGQQCLDLAKNGVHTITPFGYTSHYDSLLELRKITEVWVSSDLDAVENQYHTYYPPKNKRKKITLGFFSADFNDHPVTYCSAGMFRSLDKNKFNVVGFYWGKRKIFFYKKWRVILISSMMSV